MDTERKKPLLCKIRWHNWGPYDKLPSPHPVTPVRVCADCGRRERLLYKPSRFFFEGKWVVDSNKKARRGGPSIICGTFLSASLRRGP